MPRAGGAPRLFEGVTERKHLDEEDDEKTERTGHQLVQRRAEKLGGLESNVRLEREVFAHPRAHHQRAGVASDLHFFRGLVGVGRAVQRALGRGAELRVRDRVRVRAPLRGLSAELPAQASLAERGGEGFARVEPMDEGGLSDGGEHAVTLAGRIRDARTRRHRGDGTLPLLPRGGILGGGAVGTGCRVHGGRHDRMCASSRDARMSAGAPARCQLSSACIVFFVRHVGLEFANARQESCCQPAVRSSDR